MEEQVIQETPVASPEQPVVAVEDSPTVDITVVQSQYEQQLESLKARAAEAEEKFQGVKTKLDDVYKKQKDARQKTLEDQGQWKDLWEEANQSGQEKEQRIAELERQLVDLRTSNETAAMQTSALAAISQAGAVNAEQLLQLMQGSLKKSESGKVVVLDSGIEQDINVYLAKLKNPGSGWEHQFKPSSASGMGAKPSLNTANAAGMTNPFDPATFNFTKQLQLKDSDPELAAVLEREAGK